MSHKVAVLMGGSSAEREVSLETGAAVAAALRELGHEVVEMDVSPVLPLELSEVKPDAVFPALHGRGGEDGTVQGLLEIMRIPYAGSGVLASAAALDKVVTKELLDYHGIPVAEHVVLEAGCDVESESRMVSERISFPVMVKPASEGSSIGVTRVDGPDELAPAVNVVFERDRRALLESFIGGKLLTVGLIGTGPRVLPVLLIKPKAGFYDYKAKYQPGMTEYEVPASIPGELFEMTQKLSVDSFRILGCDDMARVDLILEEDTDRLYVLEVNTLPGMTATSLVPKAAAAAGLSFIDVVAEIMEGARLKIDLPE